MATIESYETSTGATKYMVHYRAPQRTQTKNEASNAGAVKRAQMQTITPGRPSATPARRRQSARGVNVLALSRMLGRTSAKVTLDTQADLFDADLDAVASALDSKCAQTGARRPLLS